jgi:hypothetical protein
MSIFQRPSPEQIEQAMHRLSMICPKTGLRRDINIHSDDPHDQGPEAVGTPVQVSTRGKKKSTPREQFDFKKLLYNKT